MTCCWDLCCWDLSGSTNNSYHPGPGTLEKSSPSVPISAGPSVFDEVSSAAAYSVPSSLWNQHRKKSAGVSIFGLSRALFGSCDHPDRQSSH
jgi:hypothetical protein